MESIRIIYFSLLTLCLLLLLTRRTQLPGYCLWFIPIIFLALSNEVLRLIFENQKHIITRIYQPVEFLLLLMFYNHLLRKKRNKQFLLYGYIIYLFAAQSYYLFVQRGWNRADYFDLTLGALLIAICSILFLFELLNHKGQLNLALYPAFWLNAMNLLFYAGSFFAYGYLSSLMYGQGSQEYAAQVTQIVQGLNLLLYFGYAAIFILAKKTAKANE